MLTINGLPRFVTHPVYKQESPEPSFELRQNGRISQAVNSRKWSNETQRALMSMGIVKSFSFEDLRVGDKRQKQNEAEGKMRVYC